MRRRVHAQHALGDLAELARALTRVVPANRGRPAEPRIPQDRPGELVAGHQPGPRPIRQLDPADRLGTAQLRILRVRIQPTPAERVAPAGPGGHVAVVYHFGFSPLSP